MTRFAPVVRLYPDFVWLPWYLPGEAFRPSSVDWYLARIDLRFHHPFPCYTDCRILDLGAVNGNSLLSQSHREKEIPGCDHTGANRRSWSSNPSPDAESPFYLEIPHNADKETTKRGDVSSAKCYVHVRRASWHHPRMYDVQYWFFHPYNGYPGGEHEADFEHITVRVEADGRTIHRILFAAHGDEDKWFGPGGYSLTADGRPIVYSACGSHASYPWAQIWDRPGLMPNDYTLDGGPTWDCRPVWINVGEGPYPSVGMEWLQYTGRWGELGEFDYTSGPYGPALRELWRDEIVGEDDPADHGWVIVNHWARPPGLGTLLWPWPEFTTAAKNVPSGGTILILPGHYSAVGTYTKRMILEAPLGGVTLGN